MVTVVVMMVVRCAVAVIMAVVWCNSYNGDDGSSAV